MGVNLRIELLMYLAFARKLRETIFLAVVKVVPHNTVDTNECFVGMCRHVTQAPELTRASVHHEKLQ